MNRTGISQEEILNNYGVDISMFSSFNYYINESTGMLIVFDRTRIAFDGEIKPVEVVHGSFSDTYFHYFKKLEDKQ
jgi:hypothetical protein